MKSQITPLAIAIVCIGLTNLAFAQSPVRIGTVATPEEIQLSIEDQLERLNDLLEKPDDFEDKKAGDIRQAFGLLACLGQAFAEHPKADQSKLNGAALRDAALAYKHKGTHEQAQAALQTVQQVIDGKATGEHEKLYPWNKLINMHPMMEEMNAGNSKILRVLRRPRGREDEPLPAVNWAILAIAMKADTHEVKNPADLPQWNAYSDEFREMAIKLAEAIRAKDKDEARKWFDKANETCDSCHGVFQ